MLDNVARKEKNYGECVNTVISEGRINCITFVDQGAVWMMSTVHDSANEPPCWRPLVKRKGVSEHLARQSDSGDIEIPYPQISHDYNHNMNGSDLCQQLWDEYSVAEHSHRRNWWPLFWHLVSASIANCLYIYRLLGFTDKDLTHKQLQERLGLQLLRNPASVLRKIEMTSFTPTTRKTQLQRPPTEHQWERITRRKCVVCCPKSYRTRGLGRKKRAALAELFVGSNARPPPPPPLQ